MMCTNNVEEECPRIWQCIVVWCIIVWHYIWILMFENMADADIEDI